MNLLDETNPNILQLRLAHIMANAAAVASTGQNNNNTNDGSNVDNMMNTLANIQRNFLLKLISNPMAAAQAVQAAAAATQIKANISPALITSNNKQIKSSRKRKSTPEKRVITNHRSTNNNDDV